MPVSQESGSLFEITNRPYGWEPELVCYRLLCNNSFGRITAMYSIFYIIGAIVVVIIVLRLLGVY